MKQITVPSAANPPPQRAGQSNGKTSPSTSLISIKARCPHCNGLNSIMTTVEMLPQTANCSSCGASLGALSQYPTEQE